MISFPETICDTQNGAGLIGMDEIVLLDDFGPCMYHNIIMIIHIILATLDVLRIYLAQEVK
jgi:hypothetical protein